LFITVFNSMFHCKGGKAAEYLNQQPFVLTTYHCMSQFIFMAKNIDIQQLWNKHYIQLVCDQSNCLMSKNKSLQSNTMPEIKYIEV